MTGQSPGERYRELAAQLGDPAYARIDAPATREQKAAAGQAVPGAGRRRRNWPASRCSARLTRAPGNGEPLGGIKVITESGWFAARPSGTEDVYKLYAESFQGPASWPASRRRRSRSSTACSRNRPEADSGRS